MADDRSRAGRGSWRGKSEPERRDKPSRIEKSSYNWAKRGAKPVGGQAAGSRSIRLMAGIGAFLACLGVVVWLIWMINPPRAAGVILIGADYASNLAVPQNVLGQRGLKGIEQLSRAPKPWTLFNPARLELIARPSGHDVLATADDWDQLVGSLKKGFSQSTLILVLGLQGGTDSSGAYLMPNQFRRPEDRLDMKKIIESMNDLPKDKVKILVVEGARIASDWRLGMMHNDFARRLKELEPAIRAVPNLWVLSGCDEDQQCWASEGLGRTVFQYYITEALRGGVAAGSDKRLSLDELYRFVRENVRGWAWSARGALQEPMLLPSRSADGKAGAGEPARLDPSRVHLATVEASPTLDAAQPPDRAILSRAWQRFRQLDKSIPHPSVYSPMRWRSYGATLVRYEQILLSGGGELAEPIGEQLTQLEQSIRKDRVSSIPGASAGVNLVMDSLNGATRDPAAPAEFDKILQAADDQTAQKTWDALRAAETPGEDSRGPNRPLTSRLAAYLIRRAEENPTKDLVAAANRIRLTAGPGDPLPAESHFMRMLMSPPLEGRSSSFWGLAIQAPRVRVLAERAAMGASPQSDGYAFSEQVYGWTRPTVEQADAKRRTGEDQLFAADSVTWDLARKDLDAAEAGYKIALSQAVTLQSAFSARVHAFAILPEYSRWLIHRRSNQAGEDLAGRVEQLWAKAHQLSGLLSRPGETTDFSVIKSNAQELNSGLQALIGQFVRERGVIAKERLPEDWEVNSAAATVLFADDADLSIRKTIWDRLDDIGLHDVELATKPVSASEVAKREDSAGYSEAVRRRASMEGRLALAALGETWFSDPAFKDLDQGDYRKTRERLSALATQSDEANPWWKDSAALGDRIGLRFRTLRDKIAGLADEGRGISGVAEFTAFESRLSQAEGLSRLVDRGEAPPATSAVEPASRYRQTRLHQLLLWLASRTSLDHWYSEKPSAPPYYQAIVSRLFDDAQGLFPELRDSDQKERDRLRAQGRLALAGPARDRLVVTSELSPSAEYRVLDETGPGTVPPGIPVVRGQVEGALSLLPSTTADYRLAARGSEASTGFRLSSPTFVTGERRGDGFGALLDEPGGPVAGLNIEGFFRGQVFKLPTRVELQVVPDTIAIGPAPPDPPLASVAIRSSDEIIRRFGKGTGSIAVVVDCSGSMNAPIPDGTKWTAAKAALLQVLQEIPPKTKLSIWTFSQALPGVLFDENGQMTGLTPEQLEIAKADYQEPERTIKQQRELTEWAPEKIAEIKKLLDDLHPYYETPLVDAITRAVTTDLVNVRGLKNLLVLTDGNDNRFKKDIPAYIEEFFRKLGIRVTIVYFHAGSQADKKELEEARKNFEKPLQRVDPRNRFIQAGDAAQLTASLRAGLEQKLVCQILKSDNSLAGDEPLEVTRPRVDLLRWWSAGLPPGFYTLRVFADRPYDQKVNLESGDRLVVDLVDGDNGGIAFRRALYGNEDLFQAEEKQQGGNWRVTTLGTQKTEGEPAGLAAMAAIESTLTDGSMLVQRRPAWSSFRLGVGGVKEMPAGVALRYRERLTYPAPVWQFDVPRWGGNLGKPMLSAWWLAKEDPAPAAEFEIDPSRVPYDAPLANGGVVRVEDFALEKHYVEVKPGEPYQLQPCLVIRLASPVGNPHFVDPDSLKVIEPTRFEHRYYSRAGKYAGLFWLVNASQFEILRKSKFRVFSIQRLRDAAEKLGQKVEIPLGTPGENKLQEPPQAIVR